MALPRTAVAARLSSMGATLSERARIFCNSVSDRGPIRERHETGCEPSIIRPRLRSVLRRLEHFGSVGVHVEAGKAAIPYCPDVRERRGHRLAGGLRRAGIDPKRDHPVAVGDELVRLCRESIPVAGDGNQELVENLLWRAPGTAVIRKALSLGPFQPVMEGAENARHVAAPKRFVETADNADCSVHAQIPGLKNEAGAAKLESQNHLFPAPGRHDCHGYAISRSRATAIASLKPFTRSCGSREG